MFYSIDNALQYLPGAFITLIAIAFLLAEAKGLRDIIMDRGETDDTGFRMPDKGWAYNVSRDTRCFIRPKGKVLYRVYPLVGNPPPSAALRKDHHGRYFSLKAPSEAAAEALVDKIYRGGV